MVIRSSTNARTGELAYRDAGVWCSEGRRLFGVAMGDSKHIVVAGQLEVSERYVGMLLRGERQPSVEVIARIFLVFGIRGETWGLRPSELAVQRISSTPERDSVTSSETADAAE